MRLSLSGQLRLSTIEIAGNRNVILAIKEIVDAIHNRFVGKQSSLFEVFHDFASYIIKFVLTAAINP